MTYHMANIIMRQEPTKQADTPQDCPLCKHEVRNETIGALQAFGQFRLNVEWIAPDRERKTTMRIGEFETRSQGSPGSGTIVSSLTGRIVAAWRRRQTERALEGLPYETLKDIGFPVTDARATDKAATGING